MKDKNNNKNERREILTLGLIAGAGALTGGGITKLISNAGSEKVRLINSAGEVVEVEARYISKKGKKVSNADLKKWMDEEKG